jgi:hypothetical protein
MGRLYNVGELRGIIKESSKEFQPVMGTNVEKDNKKINNDAYAEMEKATKDYDGGARNENKDKITYPESDNLGMQDLEYDQINDAFKKRVRSQMKGYTSAEAEKLHKKDPFGNADFKEVENAKERHDAIQKGKLAAKTIGLTSREIDPKDFEKQSQSVFETKKMCQIRFKNTVFMNENHMLSKVPDDFKVEGKKFIMKDKANNEFIVEWSEEPKVYAKTRINEQQKRIHELFHYKSGKSNTTSTSRLTEDKKVTDMLNRTRQLMK